MQFSTQIPAEASGESAMVATMKLIENAVDTAHVAAANAQYAANAQLPSHQELPVQIHIHSKFCGLNRSQSQSIAAELYESTNLFFHGPDKPPAESEKSQLCASGNFSMKQNIYVVFECALHW